MAIYLGPVSATAWLLPPAVVAHNAILPLLYRFIIPLVLPARIGSPRLSLFSPKATFSSNVNPGSPVNIPFLLN